MDLWITVFYLVIVMDSWSLSCYFPRSAIAQQYSQSCYYSVDMYGFTVDPGCKEWMRYFSESRKGHTSLHGRAYYQMMECLGLVKIHSPMRGDPGRVVKWLPTKDTIEAARAASEKLLKRPGAGSEGPLSSCTMIKKLEKVKTAKRSVVHDAALNHLEYIRGSTRYPLERNAGGEPAVEMILNA
uniref:Uncharacterized protein n=1 Tax=Oryza rufipogon TaxID=4529 RepID=A0A0E0N8Y0_ORYRU